MKRFSRRDHLRTHEKNIHGEDAGPFACVICTQLYKNSESLRKHIAKFHFHKDSFKLQPDGWDLQSGGIDRMFIDFFCRRNSPFCLVIANNLWCFPMIFMCAKYCTTHERCQISVLLLYLKNYQYFNCLLIFSICVKLYELLGLLTRSSVAFELLSIAW